MQHDNNSNGANIAKICLPNVLNRVKNEKSTFRKIYDRLPNRKVEAPKADFVRRMAEICKVHPTTVRCWLAGTQKPDALKISIISKELGVPENELFNN